MIFPSAINATIGFSKLIFVVAFLSLPLSVCQWSLTDLWSNRVSPRSVDRSDLGSSFRVLNFFPVPVEEECPSRDGRRRGTCMNAYECRIQRGKSQGACALGFGVCCVSSCDEEVQNNLTYVTSPGFPNLIDRPMNCSVLVRKIDSQVTQLRIDFLHFNIGQPNARTGVCEEDVMEIGNGRSTFRLCGWNSGQHVYVDVDEKEPVVLRFLLRNYLQSRMWEMEITQLGFEQRAPAGCLQYFQSSNGTLKTLNYLPNGRFLADQDYLMCMRQERRMCGISYAPCSANSFRIGPRRGQNASSADMQLDSNTNVSDVEEGSGMQDGGNYFGSSSTPPTTAAMTTTGISASTNAQREGSCRDRVLIPCDFEEFITPGNEGAGICNLEHCGDSLCEPNELDEEGNCRIETWATPFRVRVAFRPGVDTGTTLEDNTGMCINYEQLPCVP